MNNQPRSSNTFSPLALTALIGIFAFLGALPNGASAEDTIIPTLCGEGGKMTIIFHDNQNPELTPGVSWVLTKKNGGNCIKTNRRHQGVYGVEVGSNALYTLSYKLNGHIGTRDIRMVTLSSTITVNLNSFKPEPVTPKAK